MGGRHRRAGRRVRRTARPRTVEVVDARTEQAHLLTPDALAAGYPRNGRYVAVCGADVLPASLAVPGRGYCGSCTSIPAQRSGTRR